MRLQRVLEGSETACVIVAAEHTARSAGGVSIRLEPRQPMPDADARAFAPGVLPSIDDAPAARDEWSGRDRQPSRTGDRAFHAAVLASRRPFVRPPIRLPAGRWAGSPVHPRRFRGLTIKAAVIRAQRRVQSDDHVLLDFGT
jgi:hypothetical protein